MGSPRRFSVSIVPEDYEDWETLLSVEVNSAVVQSPMGLLQSLSVIDPNNNYDSPHALNLHFTVDEGIFDEFCRLLTKGQTELQEANLELFAYAAFKHNIFGLSKTCENCYLKMLDSNSSLKYWQIANSYDFEELDVRARELIIPLFRSIVKTKDWCYIGKSQLKRLLMGVKIANCYPDEVLVASVIRWSEYEHCLRGKDVFEVLESVALPISCNTDQLLTLTDDKLISFCVGEDSVGRLNLHAVLVKQGTVEIRPTGVVSQSQLTDTVSFISVKETKFYVHVVIKNCGRIEKRSGPNWGSYHSAGPDI